MSARPLRGRHQPSGSMHDRLSLYLVVLVAGLPSRSRLIWHYGCAPDESPNRWASRPWMTGASIETTLEQWESSLRDMKAQMRGLFTQGRVAASAGAFLDGLLVMSGARPGGCALRPPEILGHGGSSYSGTGPVGCGWGCATSWATRSSRISPLKVRCRSSTRPASSSRQGFLRCGTPVHGFCRRDHELPDRRSLRPTYPGMATPSSTGRCIYRRAGRVIRRAWPQRTRPRARTEHGKGYVLGFKSDHHFGSWHGKPQSPAAPTILR